MTNGTSANFVFANFFSTELLEGCSVGATTLIISPAQAAKLPLIIPGSGMEARLTLWDGIFEPEIVGCTNNLQTGAIGVVRGLEGTVAQAWPAGTQVKSALTSEVLVEALAAFFDAQELMKLAFLKLTGGTLTGFLTLHADPTLDLHAATKHYVDTSQTQGLPLTGGTMAGEINMNNNRITSLPEPETPTEPATRNYVDHFVGIITNTFVDRSGAHLASGGPAAYTLVTHALSDKIVSGFTCSFRVLVSSAAGCTLNVMGIGALPIVSGSGFTIASGFLQPGMVYSVTRIGTAWLLHEVYQPTIDYQPGDIKHGMYPTDHGRWLMADGRALPRVGEPFDGLFSVVGTQWGAGGPGGTTFNILDARGRVLAGRDNMAGAGSGAAADRLTFGESGINAIVLGVYGGVQAYSLVAGEIPQITSDVDYATPIPPATLGLHGHDVKWNIVEVQSGTGASPMANITLSPANPLNSSSTGNSNLPALDGGTAVSNNTSTTDAGATHTNVQPTAIVNVFVRF